MFKRVIFFVLPLLIPACKSENPIQGPNGQYFTVQVENEQFTMYVTDPATIQAALENFQGKNNKFPIGQVAVGNGSINEPWNWHYIPETIRMTEVSVEVCDGKPSYVNAHLNDFLAAGYCPWAGKIIKVGS
jgi:hypothetical protein